MLDKNKILSKSIIQEVSIKFAKLFGKGFWATCLIKLIDDQFLIGIMDFIDYCQ